MTENIVSEYRGLLIAEETLSSVDRAIRLLVRISLGDGASDEGTWHRLLARRSLPPFLQSDAVLASRDRARGVSWMLSKLRSRIDDQVDEIPEEQYSLLMDALLLLFHHAFFGLLPKVNGEREGLLKSFKAFADSLPGQPDKYQARGLIQMEQEDWDGAIESFRAAVAMTHSDQHDFMTRVQTMWMALMEQRRFDESFQFLLDVYPRVSRGDIEEVQELLRETYDEAAKKRKPKVASPR